VRGLHTKRIDNEFLCPAFVMHVLYEILKYLCNLTVSCTNRLDQRTKQTYSKSTPHFVLIQNFASVLQNETTRWLAVYESYLPTYGCAQSSAACNNSEAKELLVVITDDDGSPSAAPQTK